MALCAAKKTNGEPCKAQAVRGKRVCRVHGGMTPSGIASPHYKDGRYSAALRNVRFAARYETARRDSRLLDLSDEIALLDARIGDLVAALGTGESAWGDLLTAYGRLRSAMNRKDTPAITSALADVDRLITQGADEAAAWEQIGTVLEQRRKLVESESKRLVQAQQLLTVDQAMLFVNTVLSSVREHVSDTPTLTAIQNDMTRLLNGQPNVIDVSE